MLLTSFLFIVDLTEEQNLTGIRFTNWYRFWLQDSICAKSFNFEQISHVALLFAMVDFEQTNTDWVDWIAEWNILQSRTQKMQVIH